MEEFLEIFVPGQKTSYYAKKYLNAATHHLSKREYFESLENFNKCLCYAEKKSEEYQKALSGRLQIYESIDPVRLNENPWSFFKLSHPLSKKNPDVIEYLQVKNDCHFGRYVFTTKDLKPGDIIAIEKPFFRFIDSSARHLRCSHCLKSNKLKLIPSELCSSSKLKSENIFFSDFLMKFPYFFYSRHVLFRRL